MKFVCGKTREIRNTDTFDNLIRWLTHICSIKIQSNFV